MVASKNEGFFRDGIRALPNKWEKSIANGGLYVE